MAIHLYGVVEAGARRLRVRGRADAKVRLIEDGELAVLVSDVDEQARAGAADLLAHARVLETFLEHGTVIPMRFGILLPDDDAVRQEVLGHDHDQLLSLVRQFEGLVQVSVRVAMEEEPALREVILRRPDIRAVRETVPPGDVSRQIRLGESVTHALTALAAEYAEAAAPRLQKAARAAHLTEPQGVHEVLSGSYLVVREERDRFDKAVASLRKEFDGRLSIRYIGPQPPYAFLEEAQGGRVSWA